MSQEFNKILVDHPMAQASSLELEATHSKIKSSQGKWFPTVSATASTGDEYRNKATGIKTDLNPRQYSIKATQLVWDFGVVNAELNGKQQLSEQAKIKLKIVQQDLLLGVCRTFSETMLYYRKFRNLE
ncbi:MAG: TolC family protein [Magnetococcales bacterium]|nr:TolC family protein [Magnetococcales bacterium]